MVPGRDQGAVHDEHGLGGEPLAGPERKFGGEVIDNPVGCRFRGPEQAAICRMVKLVRQYAATSSTRSSKASFQGRPLSGGSAPSRRSWRTSLANWRALSPLNSSTIISSAALITPATLP
jgi:hypothetical protein